VDGVVALVIFLSIIAALVALTVRTNFSTAAIISAPDKTIYVTGPAVVVVTPDVEVTVNESG
jgi:hypothetical protein